MTVCRNVITAISPLATNSVESGHFFSLYQHLWHVQKTCGVDTRTIAREDQECAQLDGVMRRNAYKRLFSFGPSALIQYRPFRIRHALRSHAQNQSVTVISYDGGFSDFLILNWLAQEHPDFDFVYNFHWPLQWLRLLKKRTPIGIFRRRVFRSLVANKLPNLTFAAETRQFSEELKIHLRQDFPVFPVITTFPSTKGKAWEKRDFDLLLLPQRRHELSFSEEIARLAKEKGLSVAILANSRFRPAGAEPKESRNNVETADFWGPLDADDYSRLLENCRTAILPYEKDYGPWMSSGKFNDAVFHGCFPLVPSETAMASQSSISESRHWYERGSATSAVRSVENILASGFPKGLRAKEFGDLQEFIAESRQKRSTGPAAEQLARRTHQLLTCALLLALYREGAQGRMKNLCERVRALPKSWANYRT